MAGRLRRRGRNPERLTVAQILRWADAHRRRKGKWPSATVGPVARGAADSWKAVDKALRYGYRGLPGGSSLARLLHQARGTPEGRGRPADPSRALRAARLRARGLTLAEVGRKMGVSRQAVHAMLRQGEPAGPAPQDRTARSAV